MVKSSLLGVAAACLLALSPARAAEVTIFAAASTTNVIEDVGAAFQAAFGHVVVASFASSSALAKQIERGAPADVYLSASEAWADYLEERGLLIPETRKSVLGNAVVLVAPVASAPAPLAVQAGLDLVGILDGGRLAVGDPDHVPAGLYAREALVSLDLWGHVETHLARMSDVRAALALVERGEVPLGIVYATDAAASDRVRVVGTFPSGSHRPITYPVAIVAGRDSPAARAFIEFLATPAAQAIFRAHGFTAP